MVSLRKETVLHSGRELKRLGVYMATVVEYRIGFEMKHWKIFIHLYLYNKTTTNVIQHTTLTIIKELAILPNVLDFVVELSVLMSIM